MWSDKIPICVIVKSPKEYCELMDKLIRLDKKGAVIVLDWDHRKTDIRWIKTISKMMQMFGCIATHYRAVQKGEKTSHQRF